MYTCELFTYQAHNNTFWMIFFKEWTQAVVAMVPTNTTPAAASVTRDGKAQIARCPPAQTSAMTTAGVWMGNVCATRATQVRTAASWCVQTTATTKDTAWMENVCVSRTSPARTAASRSVQMTASVTAGAWMASASVMKAFLGKTVHWVSYLHI